MKATTKIALINGFDRCGGSAICRTLALHPDIELVFQPFNSGSIRTNINRILTDSIVSDEDVAFFDALERGRLLNDYIKSDWFLKYSTTQDIQPKKIHVLKTTINHLSVAWIQSRYRRIDIWAIWRNPYDILASLIRNNFHERWFKDSVKELTETLNLHHQEFPPIFLDYITHMEKRPIRAMSWILSVRSYFFLKHISKDKVLVYEDYVANRNSGLVRFTEKYGISDYQWNNQPISDLNVTGKNWQPNKRHIEVIPSKDQEFVDDVFTPLLNLGIHNLGIKTGMPTRGFA